MTKLLYHLQTQYGRSFAKNRRSCERLGGDSNADISFWHPQCGVAVSTLHIRTVAAGESPVKSSLVCALLLSGSNVSTWTAEVGIDWSFSGLLHYVLRLRVLLGLSWNLFLDWTISTSLIACPLSSCLARGSGVLARL